MSTPSEVVIYQLREALELALMYHKGGEWDHAAQKKWFRITGNEDATTRVLCDHIRVVLENTKETK